MDIFEIATMFAMALLSVSLWTFRIAITARGLKLASAVMAAVEAVVYLMSFSRLVSDLGSPGRVLGYAAGVAVGTAVGLVLDAKTTQGHTELHLVARGDRADLVSQYRAKGWPATSSTAVGPEGFVTMMWLTVPDSEVGQVTDLAQQLAPEEFWTLRRLQDVTVGRPAPDGSDSPSSGREVRGQRRRPDHARPMWRAAARRREHRRQPVPEPA